MQELGRRCDVAAPDAAIVVTPHNVHVEGHFSVVTAARVGEHEVDRALAAATIDVLRAAGLPVVGVSYGGNDATHAEHPLDWGTEIPLRFMSRRPVVVVAPARDRPLAEHVRVGELLGELPGRHALIASADQGHAHDPEGPYGFDPAAAEYDAVAQEILRSDDLDFAPLARLAEPAKADSLWQMLVLQGTGVDVELLAYAAPTYYGMLVAASAG